MKNKKKLINLPILILLFCFIFFGVYAVSKTANLQVTGTVGMIAHDCKVKASATILGDAVLGEENSIPDPNGFPSIERVLFEEKEIGIVSNKVEEDIGLIYFSDLTENGIPETIVIKISVTNISGYEIFTNVENAFIENITTKAYQNGQEIISNQLETNILNNETKDFYFSFDLNITDGDYLTLQNSLPFNIDLYFGKIMNERVLSTPKGLIYNPENNQISIDPVMGATGYLVEYVNPTTKKVVSSEIIQSEKSILKNFPYIVGSYNIRVKALGNGDKLHDSESYETTNTPMVLVSNQFPSNWKTILSNNGIDAGTLTDITFTRNLDEVEGIEQYTINENIVVGNNIHTYLDSTNKKIIFYSSDIIKPTTSVVFNSMSKLVNITLLNFDTSSYTTLQAFFANNSSMKRAICNFNTKNVTNLQDIFAICGSLEYVDVSSFDTSKVTNMRGMFWHDGAIQSIDLSNFNTSRVTNFRATFTDCKSLKFIDFSGASFSSVNDDGDFMVGCSSLTSVKVKDAGAKNFISKFISSNYVWY